MADDLLNDADRGLLMYQAFRGTFQGRDGLGEALQTAEALRARRKADLVQQHSNRMLQGLLSGGDIKSLAGENPWASPEIMGGAWNSLVQEKARIAADERASRRQAEDDARAVQAQIDAENRRQAAAGVLATNTGTARNAIQDFIGVGGRQGTIPPMLAQPQPMPEQAAPEALPGPVASNPIMDMISPAPEAPAQSWALPEANAANVTLNQMLGMNPQLAAQAQGDPVAFEAARTQVETDQKAREAAALAAEKERRAEEAAARQQQLMESLVGKREAETERILNPQASGAKTPFQLFMIGYRRQNPEASDLEVSEAWNASQAELAGMRAAQSGAGSIAGRSTPESLGGLSRINEVTYNPTNLVDEQGNPIVVNRAGEYRGATGEGGAPAPAAYERPSEADKKFAQTVSDIGGSLARIRAGITKHPEWVGPVAYRAAALKIKLGIPLEPGQAEFIADVNASTDTELRNRSGAAITPSEMERIKGFTLDPTMGTESYLENLGRFERAFAEIVDARQGARRGQMPTSQNTGNKPAPTEKIVTRTLKDGRTVKVRQLPGGKWEEVP